MDDFDVDDMLAQEEELAREAEAMQMEEDFEEGAAGAPPPLTVPPPAHAAREVCSPATIPPLVNHDKSPGDGLRGLGLDDDDDDFGGGAWAEGPADGLGGPSQRDAMGSGGGKRANALADGLKMELTGAVRGRPRRKIELEAEVMPDAGVREWRSAGCSTTFDDDCLGRLKSEAQLRERVDGGVRGRGGDALDARGQGVRKRRIVTGAQKAAEPATSGSGFNVRGAVFETRLRHPRTHVDMEDGHLLKRPLVGRECRTMVSGSGSMFYVHMRPSVNAINDPTAFLLGYPGGSSGGLLSRPIKELMARVEAQRLQRLSQVELDDDSAPSATNDLPAPDTESGESPSGGAAVGEKGKRGRRGAAAAAREVLWVDKYAPTAFANLLSDDAINREVLRAMRSWDEFVFKRALPSTLAPSSSLATNKPWGWRGGALKGHNSSGGGGGSGRDNHGNSKQQQQQQQQPGKKWGNDSGNKKTGREGDKGVAFEDASLPGNDKDKRPALRAILLCGPPGMGKTTLAHVVASHCGYRPLEINASDDRSAPVLREKITGAMQNKAILGDKRPNCIILDEADGMDGKTSMKMIVDMIKAPLGQHQGKKKNGEASVPPLTRPLICICNDLYAPALRPLREVAAVFRFRKTSSSRLMQRLKAICQSEGLPLGSAGLGALCEASGNDVRCCLNTLQFFTSKLPPSITQTGDAAALASTLTRQLMLLVGSGLKDHDRDLMQVCNMVLRKPQSQQETETALLSKRVQDTDVDPLMRKKRGPRRDTDEVLSAVASFNDHGQVLQMVHENMLQLRYTDPSFTKTSLALDWMASSDVIYGRQMELGSFTMEGYHLATTGALHLLCRVDMRPRLSMPRRDYEFRAARLSRQHLVESFMEGCSLQATWARNPTAIVKDIISPLLDILNPALRLINPDLYNPREKAALRHLIHVMLACGVSFTQTQHAHAAINGMVELEMVPDLEQLGSFGASTADGSGAAVPTNRRPKLLPGFVKLVATQEAKLEAMKKAELKQAAQAKAPAATSMDSISQALGIGNGGATHAVASAPTAAPSTTAATAAAGSSTSGNLKRSLESGGTTKESTEGKGAPASPSKKPKKDVPPTAPASKGWFVKLGTKRSSGPRNRADSTTTTITNTHTNTATTALSTAPSDSAATGADKETLRALSRQPSVGGVGGGGVEVGGVGGVVVSRPALRFKYRAGFTNAVRRPVLMKDL